MENLNRATGGKDGAGQQTSSVKWRRKPNVMHCTVDSATKVIYKNPSRDVELSRIPTYIAVNHSLKAGREEALSIASRVMLSSIQYHL